MDYTVERVTPETYSAFDAMIDRRIGGQDAQRPHAASEGSRRALENPNLRVYAAVCGDRMVGYICLIYLPKVGKYDGHGHVYVDELWVEPAYRGNGIARQLMQRADEWATRWDAAGSRLYVNTENPAALALYQRCGFRALGTAHFMEKAR